MKSNRVAVVTGASSGIGLATARRLHRDGAKVVITARDVDRLRAAAATIDPEVVAIAADVTRRSDLEQLMEAVARHHGKIDVLFVNAGVKRFGQLETTTEDLIDEVLAINTKGAYLTLQTAAPHLAEGAAVIVCGLAPVEPVWRRAGTGIYTASKSALHAITRTAAAELGSRGIRVNTVNPGAIQTEGPGYLPPAGMRARLDKIASETPLRRLGTPDDIAGVVAFLASADASWITGQQITVDGGLS